MEELNKRKEGIFSTAKIKEEIIQSLNSKSINNMSFIGSHLNIIEQYKKTESYKNDILKTKQEAQKELLEKLLKAEEQIGQDKYVKSSYLKITLREITKN